MTQGICYKKAYNFILRSILCLLPPPLLSILIPTYNRKDQLARAIDSVLGQNFKNEFNEQIEVVVQNNASTDGTYEFLESIKDSSPILKIFHNPKNLQIYGNFVEPLKNAKGKYVLYLTDDDYMLPHSLKKLLGFLKIYSYDYVRLNLITFFEKSINTSIHSRLPHIDHTNATIKQKASVISLAHVLTGNVLKKERIDMSVLKNARDDEVKRWFAYVVMPASMMDNFAFIPDVWIMHTWENELFWDGEEKNECARIRNKYNLIRDGFNRILIDSGLSKEVLKEYFLQQDLDAKLYPYINSYLNSKDFFRLWMIRCIVNVYLKLKNKTKSLLL